MKKLILFYTLSILFILSGFSFAEERVYTCYRLTKEPVLDGKLKDDPAWKSIPEVTDYFVRLGTDFPASKQTSFKIGYGRGALYIGIECEEPEVEKIKAKLEDGSPDIWTEDSVEIFLFPRGADNYYQFSVNAIGSRRSQMWSRMGLGGPTTIIPLSNWQVETYQGKNHYSVEIKIPYRIFLAAIPEEGGEWTGNICRNILTPGDDRFATWAYMKGQFHEPDNFGRILFADKFSGNFSEENVRKIKARIINMQKKRLEAVYEAKDKEIAANLKSVPLSKKEISEKAKEYPFLQKEFAALLKDYEEIENEFSQLDTMEKAEMLLKRSEDLLERSKNLLKETDKLKHEILLQSLFD